MGRHVVDTSHEQAVILECWSLLQLSEAELALREAAQDQKHAER
jgi:hypothetical protein